MLEHQQMVTKNLASQQNLPPPSTNNGQMSLIQATGMNQFDSNFPSQYLNSQQEHFNYNISGNGVINNTNSIYNSQFSNGNKLSCQIERKFSIELTKGVNGFGFTLVEADLGLLIVKNIIPNGPALESGAIEPGDVLVSVNGNSVAGLLHIDIAQLFSTFLVGQRVRLEFSRGHRPLAQLVQYGNFSGNIYGTNQVTIQNGQSNHGLSSFSPYDNQAQTNQNQIITQGQPHNTEFDFVSVTVRRGDKGFGFTISDDPIGQKVNKILDSIRCVELCQGDVLMQLNGVDISNLSHNELVGALKLCPIDQDATFIVKRRKFHTNQQFSYQEYPTLLNNLEYFQGLNKQNFQNGHIQMINAAHNLKESLQNQKNNSTNLSQQIASPTSPDNSLPTQSNSILDSSLNSANVNLSNALHFSNPQSQTQNQILINNSISNKSTDSALVQNQQNVSTSISAVVQINGNSMLNGSNSGQIQSQGSSVQDHAQGQLAQDKFQSQVHLNQDRILDQSLQNQDQGRSVSSTLLSNPQSPTTPQLTAQASPQTVQVAQPMKQIVQNDYGTRSDFNLPMRGANTNLSISGTDLNVIKDGKTTTFGMNEYGAINSFGVQQSDCHAQDYGHTLSLRDSLPLALPDNLDGKHQTSGVIDLPAGLILKDKIGEDEKISALSEDDPYEYYHVDLERGENGFGFRIMGGAETDKVISVGSIVIGGNAHRNGILKAGDEIISINNQNVMGATHQHVVELMSACTASVHLVVRRNRYSDAYDVILNRQLNEGFGFVIISCANYALIGRIIEGSPAYRCQRLHVRDRIIAVNGCDITSSMTHPEIVNMIKESGHTLKLRIIPADCYSVELIRSPRGFGFSIRGGADSSFQGIPLYVLRVAPNGPAHNLLNVGDEIIEINGISTVGMTHDQAAKMITESEGLVRLKLRLHYEQKQQVIQSQLSSHSALANNQNPNLNMNQQSIYHLQPQIDNNQSNLEHYPYQHATVAGQGKLINQTLHPMMEPPNGTQDNPQMIANVSNFANMQIVPSTQADNGFNISQQYNQSTTTVVNNWN